MVTRMARKHICSKVGGKNAGPLSDVATTLIDVAVTAADAPSMVARSAVLNSSNVLGSAAAFKEETKRTGYVGVYDAVKSGAQLFVPFVIESSGFIGLEASNFLKSVAAEAVSNGTESSENVCRARLARDVSMALHRGNGILWEAHQLRLDTARKVSDAEIEGVEGSRRATCNVTRRVQGLASEAPDSPPSDEEDDGGSEDQDI